MRKFVLTIACLAALPAFAQEAAPAAPSEPAPVAATESAPAPMAATAPEAAPAPAPAPESATSPLPRVGHDTVSWLAMQKDPAAQAADVRPMPGEVAEQVYQRYVNSFKFPIPEEFKRESFKQQSGGGS